MVVHVKIDNDGIDENAPGGKYGYRLGHSLGDYTVPDRILNAEDDRPVKIVTVGAGISGILMAYLLQRDCKNVEHVIYEKNGDIGGTWLENRYPGCACDVPSHAYTYAFALNADWPAYLSGSDDIFRYLTRVVQCFDLRKFMRFNNAVEHAEWIEEEGKWFVVIRDLLTGARLTEKCDFLIGANGLLNSWKWPEEVKGLHDFKGKLIHTARWPDEYTEKEWANDRVAVLGSGASSIQVVPSMQEKAKSLDVYIRSPVWFAELAGHGGENTDYEESVRQNLRTNPADLLSTAKEIEGGLNQGAGIKALMPNSAEAKAAKAHVASRMREFIQDEKLYDLLTPSFPLGCRRLTPGNPFMRAVQKPNVTVHRSAVAEVRGNTVIDTLGSEVEVDTLICATGFDTSYVPKYSLKGRNGLLLSKKWAEVPEGYMGMMVPDFPNYFMFQGPTFPVANGSVMGPLQTVGAYIVQLVKKMQRESIHSFDPKQDVTDQFNKHTQAWVAGSAWADRTCRSWYKNNETGRVHSIWPGSSLHYCEMIASPRYEDFVIKYEHSQNMFAFMGLGFTKDQVEGGDLSPYMNAEVLETVFSDFRGDADEDFRVHDRKNRVNDFPTPAAT
ncbi:putative sterigmatocystin biosynthesis monooxygenase stcW [Cercospora beticola]|uniref:Putative sterigmatocystin biosynthesis monooxygenase stcW n=1 Tax=Cercospora beticola TaxID=122368 RepID=A0A2G5HGF0_CERBT|nr:putative sterigmatocystin biosynthesis monooxygenase stcW [Cercospora beticola]PIA91627.1 putative sterigmatocystin biosynthesis monooxygenase stcW [Cercospora beticola]WPB05859.1 hypothetical protein RHO25_010513 [Cercospora beticola]CAK1365721.1 unnamed protein product [Cercospora beticola]